VSDPRLRGGGRWGSQGRTRDVRRRSQRSGAEPTRAQSGPQQRRGKVDGKPAAPAVTTAASHVRAVGSRRSRKEKEESPTGDTCASRETPEEVGAPRLPRMPGSQSQEQEVEEEKKPPKLATLDSASQDTPASTSTARTSAATSSCAQCARPGFCHARKGRESASHDCRKRPRARSSPTFWRTSPPFRRATQEVLAAGAALNSEAR
jgi:hypothetical protein